MEDADDDRGAHLDGVEERKLLGVQVPGGICSKSVDTVISSVITTVFIIFKIKRWCVGVIAVIPGVPYEFLARSQRWVNIISTISVIRRVSSITYCQIKASTKPIVRNSEEFVVEEPIEHGAGSQAEQEVASLKNWGECCVFQLVGSHGEKQADQEHERSMAVVTEHHSKEEWEGDDSEGCRVSFHVTRDTVHVDDELEGEGDIVGLEVGRRVQGAQLVVAIIAIGLEFCGLVIIEFARNVTL